MEVKINQLVSRSRFSPLMMELKRIYWYIMCEILLQVYFFVFIPFTLWKPKSVFAFDIKVN